MVGGSSPAVKRRNEDNLQAPSPPVKHTKPVSTNVYQDPLPILSVQKPSPPKPPPTTSKPKRNPLNNSTSTTDGTATGSWGSFDEDSVFKQNVDSSETDNQSKHEPSPHAARRNMNTTQENTIEDNNSTTTKQPLLPGGGGFGRGLVLDLNQVKLKSVPKAAPRIVKSSPDDTSNSSVDSVTPTPRAPPRSKRADVNNKGAQTPVTPISIDGIDDMCQNMDNIIAGLDDRLNDIQDNYVDESQLPTVSTTAPPATTPKSVVEKPEKPVPVKKPSITHKRPVLPPRPPAKDGGGSSTSSTSSSSSEKQQDTLSSSRKTSCTPFVPLPLKKILWKKLRSEGVQIHETPYTTTVNFCLLFLCYDAWYFVL